jgi:glycosyltransferase involved in cell wall biosynthesis
VAIVVNSSNRATLLHDALRSLAPLLCAPGIAFSIVVFDAGSTDGSIAAVESFRDCNLPSLLQLLVPADGADSSYPAGLNRACAVASAHGPVD